MQVITSENNTMVDVDGTLIVHEYYPDITLVDVLDPVTGDYITVGANEPMIRILKEKHHRGSTIFVWSAGGYEWAASVIKALDLEKYVHFVMSKPADYLDDLDVREWFPPRIYLSPNVKYKSTVKEA